MDSNWHAIAEGYLMHHLEACGTNIWDSGILCYYDRPFICKNNVTCSLQVCMMLYTANMLISSHLLGGYVCSTAHDVVLVMANDSIKMQSEVDT